MGSVALYFRSINTRIYSGVDRQFADLDRQQKFKGEV